MTDVDQKHPYGFPDEWFYFVKTGEDSGYGGVRCFEAPDTSKFPEHKLRNRALFQRLLLTLRDLSHARSALTFIREDVDFDAKYTLADLRRFQCYETTLVVSYCRPFSDSVGGVSRLSYKAMGIKLSPFVQAIHDDLMDMRNKLFAHSDADKVEYSLPVVINANDSMGQPFSMLLPPRFKEGTFLDEAKFEQVSVVVDCLSHAVMILLQAMHVHFKDQYPSQTWELGGKA